MIQALEQKHKDIDFQDINVDWLKTTMYQIPIHRKLPTTTIGAIEYYVEIYERYFDGPINERERLKSVTLTKIDLVERKAPVFYQDKFKEIVNQAAQQLLLKCKDKKNERSNRAFDEQHRDFLIILDDLATSQPSGDKVNFSDELKRVVKRQEIFREQVKLRKWIEDFEARDLGLEDMGEDEDNEIEWKDYDDNKKRLEEISFEIALMEGENVDKEFDFNLPLLANASFLKMLNDEQFAKIEQIMSKYAEDHKYGRGTVLGVEEKEEIKKKFQQLDITESKEEITGLVDEALQAYQAFFRQLENKVRDDFHEELLKNRRLRPREGIIIEDPDDVPEHVKQQLDQYDQIYASKMKVIHSESEGKFIKEQERLAALGNTGKLDSHLEEDDVESDEENMEQKAKRLKIENPVLYDRVKEEPFDEYDPRKEKFDDKIEIELDSSGDEMFANAEETFREEDDSESDIEIIEESYPSKKRRVDDNTLIKPQLIDLASDDDDD